MKKRIEIKKENFGKINEAIKAVEGKATARLLTAESILKDVEWFTIRLHFPKKKNLYGVEIKVEQNQTMPRAYKYSASGTWYTMQNVKGKWFLVDVGRDAIRQATRKWTITMTDEQKLAAMNDILNI